MRLYCVVLIIGAYMDCCISADMVPIGLYKRLLRESNLPYTVPRNNWTKKRSSTLELQDLLRLINSLQINKETLEKPRRKYPLDAILEDKTRSRVEARNGNTSGCTGVSSCWITKLGQGMSSTAPGKETELGAFGPGKK